MRDPYDIFRVGMPGKKSQLSLIIIMISLLIIGIVITAYIARSRSLGEANQQQLMLRELNQQFTKVDTMAESCFYRLAWDGLERMGKYGGYTAPPESIRNELGIGYWAMDEVNIQPNIEDMEAELNNYIVANMDACVDWNSLPEKFSVERFGSVPFVHFGAEKVVMNLSYPFTIRKDNFERSNHQYQLEFDLRFRRIYEMATQINNRVFDTTFDKRNPLAAVFPFDLNISATPLTPRNASRNDSAMRELIFHIRDPKSVAEGRRDFEFRFAARFHPSDLPRTIDLENTSKTTKPIFVFSTDKDALVPIPEDIYLRGPKLEDDTSNDSRTDNKIRVQQMHFKNATRMGVPMKKEKDKLTMIGSITYNLDYPVYGYQPNGMMFSEPTTWTYFWDPEHAPKGKPAVLKWNGMNWEPVKCDASGELGFVMTQIDGFSNYTMIDCDSQQKQTVTAENSMTKSPISCIILIVVIVLIVVIILVNPVLLTGSIIGPAGPAGSTTVTTGGALSGATASTGSVGLFGSTSLSAVGFGSTMGTVSAFTGTATALGGPLAVATGAAGAGAVIATAAVSVDKITNENLPMQLPHLPKTGISAVTGHVTDTTSPPSQPLFSTSTVQEQEYSVTNTGLVSPATPANYTMQGNQTSRVDQAVNASKDKEKEKDEQPPKEEEGCINFKPACDGTITVTEKNDKAKGKCSMKSGTQVKGGQTYQICSIISDCDCFCGCTCTLSCEVSYT